MFALGWLALVAWAVPVFVLTEAMVPRRAARVRWAAIGLACVLVGIDALITRALGGAPPAGSAVRALGAFGLSELLSYVVHRGMHRIPLLWRFHRLHHDHDHDRVLAWHVAWRIHPVDAALFALANLAACHAVGAALPASIAFVVGRRIWTIAIHANVPWPATLLDVLIATPAFHRRHHEVNANYAGTFPIIDLVFGTFSASTPARS